MNFQPDKKLVVSQVSIFCRLPPAACRLPPAARCAACRLTSNNPQSCPSPATPKSVNRWKS